jgi:hypothetical protein
LAGNIPVCKLLPSIRAPPIIGHVLTRHWLVALGAQLQNLDIFQVDRDRWYNAEFDGGEESVRAVVGFLRGQKSLPEEMRKRKRPRTDTIEA